MSAGLEAAVLETPGAGLSTRERIVRATTSLFAAQGYHGTAMSDITRATGLTKGALYHHVASKEALLQEICRTQIMRIVPTAEAIVSSDVPVEARMRELARALLANIATYSEEWAVFFSEFRSLNERDRAEIVAARDRYEACWRELLAEGQAGGQLVAVPPIVVKGILGMFNYTYLWLRTPGDWTPERLADLFVTLILDGSQADRTDRPSGMLRTHCRHSAGQVQGRAGDGDVP